MPLIIQATPLLLSLALGVALNLNPIALFIGAAIHSVYLISRPLLHTQSSQARPLPNILNKVLNYNEADAQPWQVVCTSSSFQNRGATAPILSVLSEEGQLHQLRFSEANDRFYSQNDLFEDVPITYSENDKGLMLTPTAEQKIWIEDPDCAANFRPINQFRGSNMISVISGGAYHSFYLKNNLEKSAGEYTYRETVDGIDYTFKYSKDKEGYYHVLGEIPHQIVKQFSPLTYNFDTLNSLPDSRYGHERFYHQFEGSVFYLTAHFTQEKTAYIADLHGMWHKCFCSTDYESNKGGYQINVPPTFDELLKPAIALSKYPLIQKAAKQVNEETPVVSPLPEGSVLNQLTEKDDVVGIYTKSNSLYPNLWHRLIGKRQSLYLWSVVTWDPICPMELQAGYNRVFRIEMKEGKIFAQAPVNCDSSGYPIAT